MLVLGGLFSFENEMWQRSTVWIACAVVLIMPLVFYIVRKDVGNQLIAAQICFDLLSFPIINKMTSVFACTSDMLRDDSFANRCALSP